MEQSTFWEANRSSSTQEIPRAFDATQMFITILMRVWPCIFYHHHIHNSPPTVPILSQIDSVQASILSLKIYFNNIPQLCLGLRSRFCNKN